VFEGESRGENGERFRPQIEERAPGDFSAAVLESERLAEIVFRERGSLEQKGADPSTGEVLNFESPGELSFRDQIGPDEEMADSRFQGGRDYRAVAGGANPLAPPGTSRRAARLFLGGRGPRRPRAAGHATLQNVRNRFLAVLLAASFVPAALALDATLEARKVYLRARSAVSDGRYREALELYRRVIEQLPEDAVVRFEYAQLLRDLNVADEAGKQAREAVRLDPSLSEARRLLGSIELSGAGTDPARLDRAIEELRQAHRLAPEDAATTASLARALLKRGRPAEAAALLDGLPGGRTQPGLMRLTAEARGKSGRFREAEAVYRELLELDPGDRESQAALVDLYEDQDRLEEAVALLLEMEKRDPDNAAIGERITLDFARAGRFGEAEKRAREQASRRPENRSIRRLLASVLFEKADVAGGEKILQDLVKSDPEDEAARRALAGELLRERRFTQARPLLEESLRRAGTDPKNAAERQWAQVELAYLFYLQKDYASARKVLEPATVSGSAVNPRAVRILLLIARDTEDFAYGLAQARAAAAADRENPEWIGAIAEFQFRSGDRRPAVEALDRLAGSKEAERTLAAADVYARLKEYPTAARLARDAVGRFPESPEALFRLGSSLERAGDSAEAEKVFSRLLEMRPNDSAAQNYLGYMWADRGVNLEKAHVLLEKAVGREPRNGAYLDSLGWVYFRMGKFDAAQLNLLEAHRREPDDPTIEEHLGDLSERQGNVARAVTHWERALTLKPEEPDKVRKKLARYASRTPGAR
jgi:tetratricopeptide (TPR) repeat protein